MPSSAQLFHAPHFKVREVVGVMYASLGIRFLITHSNLNFMRSPHPLSFSSVSVKRMAPVVSLGRRDKPETRRLPLVALTPHFAGPILSERGALGEVERDLTIMRLTLRRPQGTRPRY